MVQLEGCAEVLVSSNHLLRDHEPWEPFLAIDNGLDDLVGLVRVSGSGNSIIGNHFSEVIDATTIRPAGARPVIIRLTAGGENYVAANHVVASSAESVSGDSAFAAQVEALLSAGAARRLPVTTVLVDAASTRNIVLDSGTEAEVELDLTSNAFRATPALPAP